MNLTKLIAYSFEPNVGKWDRAFRVASGVLVAAAGWLVGAPVWAAAALTLFGVAWLLTGVVSRCGIYYILGYSTCPHASTSTAKT